MGARWDCSDDGGERLVDGVVCWSGGFTSGEMSRRLRVISLASA